MFKEYNIVYQLMLAPENHTGRRKNKGEQIWGLPFGRAFLNEVNRQVVNLQTNMTSKAGCVILTNRTTIVILTPFSFNVLFVSS